VVTWYVQLLNNKANRTERKGDFAGAETLYQRGIALAEARFGPDSLELVNPINNLAIVHYQRAEYGTAATMMQRVLAIQQKALPPTSQGIAISLTNLGAFYYKAGDYLRAEQLYQQAKTLWEKLGNKQVFQALNGIAIIQLERGDYTQAEALWQKVLELIGSGKAAPSQSEAIILSNLAGLYERKDDYAQAEAYQLRALEMRKQTFSPEHPEVAISLNRLGGIYYQKGEYAKAAEYYTQGLNLLRKTVGAEHVDIAFALHGLAKTAQKQQQYTKAEPLYQEALKMRQKLIGEKHVQLAESFSALASLYQETGDFQQALRHQAQANELNEISLKRNLSAGSERQKLAFLALFARDVNATLGLHAWNLPDNQEAAQAALTVLLQSKGRGLDAMADTMATFRRHADAEQLKLYDKLSVARSQLANITLRGLGSEKPAQYQMQLKKLEEEIDKLEADLSRRSAEFSSEVKPVTIAALRALLPVQTSLIEFAAYQPYQFSAKTAAPLHYLAYVLHADGTLRWKELGEAATIDQAVEALRQALRDPSRTDVRQRARQVDEMVMQPLRPLVNDKAHLLISPDGLLNLLPFAALVDEQDRYLVERYAISYLSSGRDLLRLQVSRQEKSAPLIVADPDFDLSPKPLANTLAKRGTNRRSATLHGVRASRDDFSKWSADRLFETAKEAEAIKALWPQAALLVREKATKAALQQSTAPSILHIATHGFFLDGAKDSTDPLLRSGLILAGFNQHKTEGDNGVLTAKEAAGLNLWGTKLVVLSACDTGVGEVKNGEGVYGLRRALMLAGAETQVMSLWPVDDVATREWMTMFYAGLKQGLGRGEALRQVQLKLLQKKSRQHPFYWAGFIPSGEWGNLENKR
ncbi:MAG TPA: CHAT domain-containing tetratricopeptide repeat protein, partial [Blastocatellia bacterium]|nr:CHAT domain-containing tetratricopeptide repeat protein [Blastocatellia bacterium]